MDPLDTLIDAVLPAFRETTREAGALALRYFEPGLKTSARVWSKSGGSPVTEADIAVDAFLKARLGAAPAGGGLAVGGDGGRRPAAQARLVWIVDPIDGTRAFASGGPDWSVVGAPPRRRRAGAGHRLCPGARVFYEACRGGGASRDGERDRGRGADRGAADAASPARSRSSTAARTAPAVEADATDPSLALRLARVADGCDRRGLVSPNARDWDLAAADLILARPAAG